MTIETMVTVHARREITCGHSCANPDHRAPSRE